MGIRAIPLKKAYSHCFSYLSWRAFTGFGVNLDGRGVMKTHGGGYMHVMPYPLAGSKLPRLPAATDEL
jgi:hypothetical protein